MNHLFRSFAWYNDGRQIPEATDDDAWSDLTTGTVYGNIYNRFAVNTGKLAPPG
ncbi:MAG: hypothetical protein MI684_00845 [Chlorobiales bacterium]|nr:hypothetical protein [Chlorobiales bacterium]